MAKSDQHAETIVAEGMRIEGELKSSGDIRIDGKVSGKVHTSQDLMVGAAAQIDADLIAANAVIAGVVKGNVTVKGGARIEGTGRVFGNISCARLSVEDGAVFIGNCRMQEQKPREIVEVEEPVED